VASLVDKPSSEGAAAKHYVDRLTRRRMERSEAGRGQAALVQLLVLAAATWALAAAGDCFGTTCWEGEAGSPVTVGSLPARGRPPQAAARRAGLELVEKVVTNWRRDLMSKKFNEVRSFRRHRSGDCSGQAGLSLTEASTITGIRRFAARRS
jgi:hypothetical protein